jgi:hypothetical protein
MAIKTSNLAVPTKDGNSKIPEYFGNMATIAFICSNIALHL